MSTINNRDFTRYNFRPNMWVKILRVGQKTHQFKMFKLLDVSKGGISFISHSATEFKRKDEFHVLEIEGKILETPLRAVVKYVRSMDDFGIDYKIGVEFLLVEMGPE